MQLRFMSMLENLYQQFLVNIQAIRGLSLSKPVSPLTLRRRSGHRKLRGRLNRYNSFL